jgi:hypothetical protein
MSPYNGQFPQLALFSFHIAKSGNWRNSPWQDGRVAGWANDFILAAWDNDDWNEEVFSDDRLFAFIKRRVEAEEITQRKVFTNYRYMLKSAGVLDSERLKPNNLRQRWLLDAVQLFWDREIFDGSLNPTAGRGAWRIFSSIKKFTSCFDAVRINAKRSREQLLLSSRKAKG